MLEERNELAHLLQQMHQQTQGNNFCYPGKCMCIDLKWRKMLIFVSFLFNSLHTWKLHKNAYQQKIMSLLASYWHPYWYCQDSSHYLQILKPALTKKLPDIIFREIWSYSYTVSCKCKREHSLFSSWTEGIWIILSSCHCVAVILSNTWVWEVPETNSILELDLY